MIAAIDVLAAGQRLRQHVQSTPLRYSPWLSAATQASVFLKLESVQLTNSFKIRGAFHAALRVLEENGSDPNRTPELVAASAGNHGRALALAAARLKLRATIFTPRTAPENKRAAIRRHGANLHDDAGDYDAAEQAARAYARDRGGCYISPYNHPDVIAGAGTIALEIVAALPRFDAVIVPVGGGGLVSGVGTMVRACTPGARVIGVETAASMPFAAAFEAGTVQQISPQPSIADGLIGNLEPGALTLDIARRVVTTLCAVDEAEILSAIRDLADEEHLIAEGAAAVGVAAVLARRVVAVGETAVIVLTGANIDRARLAEICGASL